MGKLSRFSPNLSPFGLKFDGFPENMMKIRDFHQKWDFMYFQRENTDFEDKFAPNGQIYHDFEEI